ncbi:hypothetical protein MMC24_004133 [Lignoscripta atroalba]|nr:hypothetical protein [Lignoscripta atroalba]
MTERAPESIRGGKFLEEFFIPSVFDHNSIYCKAQNSRTPYVNTEQNLELVRLSYFRSIYQADIMKVTSIIAALALGSLSSAWKLTIYTTTPNQYIQSSGTQDVGCNAYTIAHTAVNRAKFEPATAVYPDPSTFQLFSDTGCINKVYSNGGGDFAMAARTVKSYKVY